jgi:hypothetical protein
MRSLSNGTSQDHNGDLGNDASCSSSADSAVLLLATHGQEERGSVCVRAHASGQRNDDPIDTAGAETGLHAAAGPESASAIGHDRDDTPSAPSPRARPHCHPPRPCLEPTETLDLEEADLG